MTIEELAKIMAVGNNGGTWSDHYTDDQKNVWRERARDVLAKMTEKTPIAPADDETVDLLESWAETGLSVTPESALALIARIRQLIAISADLMGDDETKPRYTTKRLRLEIAKAVEAMTRERDEARQDASRLERGYILIEKRLCDILGKQWAAEGMSCNTLLDEVAAHAARKAAP